MVNAIEAASPQTADLKPCPFCGGKAEVYTGTVFMRKFYKIRCTRCHCSTKKTLTGLALHFDGQLNVDVTDEQAKTEARSYWNKRITEVI